VSAVGRREGLGENLSPLPCVVLEQGLERLPVYRAERHDHKAKSCLGLPIWLVATGRQGSRPPVCASTLLLWSNFQGLTSSQASHSFREGYLPPPQRHRSALENLVPSFPASDKEKCLEMSGSFTPCKFPNTITFRLF